MSAVEDLRQTALEESGFIARLRELCGDDEQAFLDMIEAETEVTEAARRVVRWMAEQEANAEAMRGLAATYTARAKVFDGRYDGAKDALFSFLQFLGLPSMPLPEASLSIRREPRKLIGDGDADKLPDDLCRIKRELNRTAIKAAIEAGQHVPGFSLSNGGQTIAVRMK